MDLNECKRKGYIRKTKANTSLIKSLIEISNLKEKTVKSVNIDEENVSAFLPMAYDSVRGLLEAFCVLYEFKVTSHVCLGELMNELMDDFDYNDFDRFRYIRNSINYYGEKIGFEEGNEIIKKIFDMKVKILEKIKFKMNGD
jgi:hypothetical protein